MIEPPRHQGHQERTTNNQQPTTHPDYNKTIGRIMKGVSMFRRGMVILLSLLLVSAAWGQDEALWLAWLYNPADGRMTLVNDSGEIQQVLFLPLPPKFVYPPFEVTVSDSGARVGYIVSDEVGKPYYARVYDINREEIITDYDLTELLPDDSNGDDSFRFNETLSALALSYGVDDGWQILILDLNSSFITLSLRSASPQAVEADILSGEGISPLLRRYHGSQVTFSTVVNQPNSESSDDEALLGLLERGSYTWDLTTNRVRVDTSYPAPDGDFLALTGESLVAVADPDLPNQSRDFPYAQANALYVHDPVQGESFPLFNVDDHSFYFPRFIQNGARILLGGFDSEGQSTWYVIERSGELVGEWSPPSGTVLTSVRGMADGFLYTVDTLGAEGGHATLLAVDTTEGLAVGRPVYSSASNTYPRLVWVLDRRLRDSLPRSAKEWGRLTEDEN
jgi:hypothetical protein